MAGPVVPLGALWEQTRTWEGGGSGPPINGVCVDFSGAIWATAPHASPPCWQGDLHGAAPHVWGS